MGWRVMAMEKGKRMRAITYPIYIIENEEGPIQAYMLPSLPHMVSECLLISFRRYRV